MGTAFAIYYLIGQALLACGLHKVDAKQARELREADARAWVLTIAAHVVLMLWPLVMYQAAMRKMRS